MENASGGILSGQNNGKIIAIDSSKGVLEIEERYRGSLADGARGMKSGR